MAESAAMIVHAWGITDADIEHAVRRAGQGESRKRWRFVEVERLGGSTCPIDVRDPKVVAADEGGHWAYAVYPVRDAE